MTKIIRRPEASQRTSSPATKSFPGLPVRRKTCKPLARNGAHVPCNFPEFQSSNGFPLDFGREIWHDTEWRAVRIRRFERAGRRVSDRRRVGPGRRVEREPGFWSLRTKHMPYRRGSWGTEGHGHDWRVQSRRRGSRPTDATVGRSPRGVAPG